MTGIKSAILLLSCLGCAVASAADRPDEADLFGNSAPSPASSAPNPTMSPVVISPPNPPPPGRRNDAEELSSSGARDAFATGEVTDNGLTLGGIYYQRAMVSGRKGGNADNSALSLPMQFDAFMDARPNDRLRGFIDGRLLYDAASSGSNLQFSSTSAAPTSFAGGAPNPSANGSASTSGNTQVVLDAAWLKFDIDRTVFVTAGKQHVKWGTGRFWNPTDLLSSQRRDPLLPFDLRLGNTMLKFQLPWEAKKMSLYAIALFDNAVPASSLGQLGGAFRAEAVIGPSEVGIDLIARSDRTPVYGLDVSSPLGPIDVYLEAACVTSPQYPHYEMSAGLAAGADLNSLFTETHPQGPFLQLTLGGDYQFGWRDNRSATVGVEYFYNQLGYSDASVYPYLIFQGIYQPFYTGKNYAAVYMTAEGPDAAKHTSYTFSILGNLSDLTMIARIDFAWRLLTYLTFGAYADAHFGNPGGEFNFALNTPPLLYQGTTIPAANIPPTLFDLGMSLRMSF